jgi:hypothetical protein
VSLKRWFKEKWTKKVNGKNVECGSDEGQDDAKCRPSKKISQDTPKTWSELTPEQEKKAIADKNKANRKGKQFSKVRFSKLRNKVNLKK